MDSLLTTGKSQIEHDCEDDDEDHYNSPAIHAALDRH